MTHVRRPRIAARSVLDAPHPCVADWDALGTYVRVIVAAPEHRAAVAAVVADVLDQVDRAYSRFRADSELRRLPGGRSVPVSALLAGAVQVGLQAAADTDGLVDPTLGAVLRAAGYDRSYQALHEDPTPVSLPQPDGRWRDIRMVQGGPGEPAYLLVPHGVHLDLGATGKAYAVDVAAATVQARLGVPALVSVGGDIAVTAPVRRGRTMARGPRGGWSVAVAPTLAQTRNSRHRVRLVRGGLATSVPDARGWDRGGRRWHHLIDPRTNQPCDTPWASVSALGRSCVAANIATAWAVVLGPDAPAALTARGVAARLTDRHGRVVTTPGWPKERTP